MTSLLHIADRVLNRPLLITRDKAQVVLSVLAGRIGVDSPEASRFEGEWEPQLDAEGRPVRIKPYKVKEGVAIITITGSLVNRGAWIGASSGLTSYEGIGHQLKTAADDPSVHSVLLDLHSPGGEAVGAFETAALVRQVAKRKRTVAVVNGMAASAAYAMASGASEIVTTETGVSGSIGVVLLHADFSRKLDREGITPTLIHAGAHKVDGNPFEPLTDDVRGDLQGEVNSFYEAFLATVAQGRGARLNAQKARATEARTFIGARAVDAGVADRVGTFDSALAELTRSSSGRTSVQNRRPSMDNPTGSPAAENDADIPKTDHDRLVAAAETRGKEAGATAERQRFASILGAEGVKGNATAMTAAMDMATKFPTASAEDVTSFLGAHVKGETAAAPAASSVPAAPAAGLAQRMAAASAEGALPTTDQPAAKGKGLLSLAESRYPTRTN